MMMREVLCPDTYLSGVLVEETIRGISTAKHYIGKCNGNRQFRKDLICAVNEQEVQRKPSKINGTTIEVVSSNVDDKTMHET